MNKVYIESGENYEIGKDKEVKVTQYEANNEIEIKHIGRKIDSLKKYRKLNKEEYVDTDTGQIFKYKNSEEKKEANLRRALKKMKEVLRNNFNGGKNELFITLTAEKSITEHKKIREYFNKLWDKLRRIYEGLEYVYTVELQENRKSWHIHVLIKSTKLKNLYIDNEELQKLWGLGHTKTQRITKTQSIGNKEENDKEENNDEITLQKAFGYLTKIRSKEDIPLNQNVYYRSRGIKEAESKIMTKREADKLLDKKYTFENENTTLVKSKESGCILNYIKTELWKQTIFKGNIDEAIKDTRKKKGE